MVMAISENRNVNIGGTATIIYNSQNDMHGGQSFAFWSWHGSFYEKADEKEVYQTVNLCL